MRHWNPELLEQLLQVQEVDLKIRALENVVQELYRKSKEEDPFLARLKHNLAITEESRATTQAQNEMYASTLEDIRTAIKGLATTKSGAPKPRTRSSTEALRIEEEKLSALIIETDEQAKELIEERLKITKQIEARTLELEKIQQGPEAEIRKLRSRIRRLEKNRTDVEKGIPSMLLRKYNRLRGSRSGIGLTIILDGVCTICRMQMPTAIASRLNNNERLAACPACGRMVARVEITPPTEKPVPEPKKSTASAKKKATKKKAPGKKAPVKKAPVKETPVKKAPVKETPVKKAPKVKTADKKTPPKKAPVKKAPKKKTADKKTPSKKAPLKKAPKVKTADKKTPPKEAPAKEVSKVEIADKKTPPKEAPAKEVSKVEIADKKTPLEKAPKKKAPPIEPPREKDPPEKSLPKNTAAKEIPVQEKSGDKKIQTPSKTSNK